MKDMQGEKQGETKTQSSETAFHLKNRIHGKQKATPMDVTKIIWRRFFFSHDIPLSLQQVIRVMQSVVYHC